MGVLQDFERRLEGAVEGFFARAFRSGVQPIELAKAIQRYAQDNQHVTADGVVVPNVYRLTVSPKDHDRLAGFGASLPRELGELVVRTASERGWILKGPVKVRIEVDDEVRLGRFRLTGRVEAVDPSVGTPNRLRGGSLAATPGPGPTAPPPQAAPPQAASASQAAPAAPESSASSIDRTQVITSAPRAALHLVVRSGPAKGASVPVTGQRITVGRRTGCALALDDSTVSREHAAFVKRGDTWWVVDLGSTNGTRVNGVQAAEQPVGPGDRVELGDAVVELVEG